MDRLSGLDASFLYLETAGHVMNGCAIWELDTSTMPGGYTFSRLRDGLSLRINAMPRFREKLADSALNLDYPVWVRDSTFHIDRHLHRIVVPEPGGRAELSQLCGDIASLPLDRSRPLWEIWVIEGVAGTNAHEHGHLVVMMKVHHAMMDAATGVDLMSHLCSREADAPAADPVDGVTNANQVQIALSGLARFASRPLRLAVLLLTTLYWLLVKLLRTRTRSTMARPFAAPRTVFNAKVTGRRNVAYAQLNLDDVKKVKNHFNVTVNDVVTALVSGVLRQYLLDRGELPDSSLVAMVPISLQGRSNRPGRNQVFVMLSKLETEIADPAERLKAIAESNTVAKQQLSSIGLTLAQDWLQFVAAPALFRAAMGIYARTRLHERRPLHNLAVSNVPGPQHPWYLSGCRVLAQYPLGPVFPGSGLNITVMSLTGKLNIGITSCPELLPNLWELADDFAVRMAELLAATR